MLDFIGIEDEDVENHFAKIIRNKSQFFINLEKKIKDNVTCDNKELEYWKDNLLKVKESTKKPCDSLEDKLIIMIRMRIIDFEITNLEIESRFN